MSQAPSWFNNWPGANFSLDNHYRWILTRPTSARVARIVLWVMLNPSTADAAIDDPTIKRVDGFTRSWGYDGAIVVNMYAWRATDPSELWRVPDAIGTECDKYMEEARRYSALVLCAWGQVGPVVDRPAEVKRILGKRLHVLGINKNGQPKHPLYTPSDLRPILWQPSMRRVM